MLGKLIKHELRATGRIMLPALGALTLLAVFAALSMHQLEFGENAVPMVIEFILVLIFVSFFIGIVAVAVMTLWLIISRFYKNLLGEEGYLMFTLPVSVHQHIWSKLLVAVLWLIVAGAVITVLVSGLIISLTVSDFGQFMAGFPSWREIVRFLGVAEPTMFLIIAEIVVFSLLGSFAGCMMYYAAMAIGQCFANRKLLFSFLFYLALSFAASTAANAIMLPFTLKMVYEPNILNAYQYVLVPGIIVCVIQFVAMYILCALFLKKKLNLA